MSDELEKNLISWIILSKVPPGHVVLVENDSLKVRYNNLFCYLYRQAYGQYRSITVRFLKSLLDKNIELCNVEFSKSHAMFNHKRTKRLVTTMIEAFEKSILGLNNWSKGMRIDDEFSAEILLFIGRLEDRIDTLKKIVVEE